MRWDFINPHEPEDDRRKAAVVGIIDRWWQRFAAAEKVIAASFSRKSDLDVVAFMHDHLAAVDQRLMWEFGPGLRGGHRLVITPESQRQLRPLLRTLLERVPELPGWEFYPHRLPEPELLARALKARLGKSAKGLLVRAAPSATRGVDLDFALPGESELDTVFRIAFVSTETVLGEEVLDTWIDRIDTRPEAEGNGWLPVAALPGLVATNLEALHALRPEMPFAEWALSTKWTLLELKPADKPDYPRQDDMWLAKTPLVDLFRATRRAASFSSSRFSARGEKFCYLKTDGSEELDPDGFADKAEIEDAVDAALGPERLGGNVGGGTGRRYSYVDMAVTDVRRALDVVLPALRAGKLPKRSWILFFDAEWQDEWVGVWPDSPPPPQPEPS